MLASIIFALIIEWKIKTGTLTEYDGTIGYKPIFRVFIRIIFLISLVSVLILLTTKSFEVAIGLGVFAFACALAGLVQGLLYEYQAKRR